MRYRQSNSGGSDERAFIPLDSQLSDRERFKDANPFLIQCRSCKGQLNFSPINDREVSSLFVQTCLRISTSLLLVFYCSAFWVDLPSLHGTFRSREY
jgi:hypothetical protein